MADLRLLQPASCVPVSQVSSTSPVAPATGEAPSAPLFGIGQASWPCSVDDITGVCVGSGKEGRHEHRTIVLDQLVRGAAALQAACAGCLH